MAESFRDLPGGVGAHGVEGRIDPTAFTYDRVPAPLPAETGEKVRQVDFDPVSRVAGPLAFHTVLDLENREVVEASSMPNIFRGYELVLEGRDPRDAIFVSSRACGVCGSAHAPTAASAIEMAFGIQPPPMAVTIRNLLQACDALSDYCHQLFMLAGPDYSEGAVRRNNPELWERAQATPARGVATHGFERISHIMTGLGRLSGDLWAEALHMSRIAREAFVVVGGKYPHPQTTTPGGMSATVDTQDVNVMILRVVQFLDYGQRVVAVWDDLVDFFYEANPRYREVGAAPMNFLDFGLYDDPWSYDATFEGASQWGEARWATPGAVTDGRLVTTDLKRLNQGLEEFVEHSFYESWSGSHEFSSDPGGAALSPNHPWNKVTVPAPGDPDIRGRYSWSTAPRWDRQAVEAGSYSRLWTTALANKMPHRRFIEPTGHSLKLAMPQGSLPARELEWHVPQFWGAFERNRARAYAMAYTALVAYEHMLVSLDLLRKGQNAISTHYKVPKDFRVGVGLGGGPRGAISHHIVLDDKVMEKYQIISPSTFTAGPRDPFGNAGPLEQAVASTPLLNDESSGEHIDVLRAIRSFDLCLSCGTH